MATQKQARKAGSARKAAQPANAPQSRRTGQPAQAGKTGQAGRTGNAGQADRTGTAGQADRTATARPAGQTETAGPARRTGSRRQASGASLAANGAQASTEAPAGPLWRRLAGYPGAHKLEFATMVASVLGLAVSIYLTIEHFTQNSYALCPANATFNCGKVTTSAQSHVFGIPVAVLGLAFFIFMVTVNSARAWRASQPAVHWARLGSVIVGMIFVLYLIYAELFLINAICLYCTSVHALTFILFALIVSRATLSGVKPMPATR